MRSRRRSRLLVAALAAALAGHHQQDQHLAAASVAAGEVCANASSVVAASETDALVYDAACQERRVRASAAPARELNLSDMAIALVRSLPRVYALDISANALETLQLSTDNDLNHLELRNNRIADLTACAFPPRLTYLGLSQNRILALQSPTPWPTPAVLQTLVLDENPISRIDGAAFAALRSLQSLSLVKTALKSLNAIQFPPSLSVLNVSSNALESDSTNFSNLPTALQYLDVSKNKLTKLPARISDLDALIELNLASNSITRVEGVQLPKSLKTLNLDGNALVMFEICRADVPTLARLQLSVPAFDLTTCTTAGATLERINSISVCVVRDCVRSPSASAAAAGVAPSPVPLASATPAAATAAPPAKDASVLNNGSTASASAAFSSKALVVIGAASFAVGLLVAALAIALYRKRASDAARRRHDKARHYHAFGLDEPRSGTAYDDDDDDAIDAGQSDDSSWVFEHPHGFPSAVALLEEDDDRTRSKKPGLLDDLLVYEIPPEEIKLRGAAPSPSSSSSSSASLDVPTVELVAEYQGYHVLLHALVRQKKAKRRDERRFIEQIRLASVLEHPSLVQFIGLTFGTTASRREHDATATPRWAFAVVFEHMARGSLAAMCARERSRRDGTAYFGAGASDASSLFSWFPSRLSASAAPDADWRCKLSIALDIAMALVYLHAHQLVHGRLSARRVFVNDHGEAKLSALDVSRPRDSPDDAVGRTSARMKMKHMISFKQSSFSQSSLGSSLLHGGAAAAPTRTPETPLMRETQGDIYAFGLLLWELDTMLSLDALKDAAPAAPRSDDHASLTFTRECPREIERLARRCWSHDAAERPDALDLQEELVQLLEGRITTSSQAGVSSWLRTTNQSLLSSVSSSNLSASSSLSSASVYALSEVEASI